ncbi:MAG: Hsp20/alpha crystallin family protein [Planctomycetota bacterium]
MRSRLRNVRQKAESFLSAMDALADYLPGRAVGVFKGHPRVNIYEEDDRYVYRAELPGVEQEDLELTMQGRELTISGEKKRPETDGTPRKEERAYGSFTRKLTLPEDADLKQDPDASLKNGILRITVPKKSKKTATHVQVSGQEEPETHVSVGEGSADESDEEQPE